MLHARGHSPMRGRSAGGARRYCYTVGLFGPYAWFSTVHTEFTCGRRRGRRATVKARMRILFCVNAAPLPPMDGFRLVVDALVRELRERPARHDVRVLAFRIADQDERDAPEYLRLIPHMQRGVWAKARLFFGASVRGRPLSADVEAARMRA